MIQSSHEYVLYRIWSGDQYYSCLVFKSIKHIASAFRQFSFYLSFRIIPFAPDNVQHFKEWYISPYATLIISRRQKWSEFPSYISAYRHQSRKNPNLMNIITYAIKYCQVVLQYDLYFGMLLILPESGLQHETKIFIRNISLQCEPAFNPVVGQSHSVFKIHANAVHQHSSNIKNL